MSARQPPILTAYRTMLACYPPRFRAEFGAEMLQEFAIALGEARHAGREQPWRLCWREIRDWPVSVVVEHFRERRRRMSSLELREEKPLSPGELLVAMALFALPLFGILSEAGALLPGWLVNGAGILWAAAFLLALGWALVKGFPRWSLPYLGLVLLFGLILSGTDRVWGWIYPLFTKSFGPRFLWSIPVRVLYVAAFESLVLLSFLLLALLLVSLLRLPPHTRALWQQIRADWTRLSFLLYGGMVLNLWSLFDEYRHEGIWLSLAGIALALGAWGYLRASGQKRRIAALIGGATAAMGIVALAKWALIPLQAWPAGYPASPSEVTRWVEVGSALTGWLAILVLLLAPALLRRRRRAPA